MLEYVELVDTLCGNVVVFRVLCIFCFEVYLLFKYENFVQENWKEALNSIFFV